MVSAETEWEIITIALVGGLLIGIITIKILVCYRRNRKASTHSVQPV